jgi:hypothetical protein
MHTPDHGDRVRVDIGAREQVGHGVGVILDNPVGVVVGSRLTLALAEAARIEGQPRVSGVGQLSAWTRG